MGNLYILSTPIGNLQDITLRALKVIKEVDFIVCEDTRNTGNLIHQLVGKENIKANYISYFEHNEAKKIPEIISLLLSGKNIALISDSGTPLISDPGFKLIRECIKNDITVMSIPGPSSVISALVSSGLPTDKFLFLGFLPKKQGNRSKLLSSLKKSLEYVSSTVIIFESPHRVIKTLVELKDIFGDINAVSCRELTKIHEEINRGRFSYLIDHFNKKLPRGEFVLLFNPKDY